MDHEIPTDPTIESARQFVTDALASFVKDPADSDYHFGYLHALYVFGNEALGMGLDDGLPKDFPSERSRPQLRVVE